MNILQIKKMLKTEVVLKLYNYLPLRKLIKFELSFTYLWVSYGHKNQNQVRCTYLQYALISTKSFQKFQISIVRTKDRETREPPH